MKTEHNGEWIMNSCDSYGAPQGKPREFLPDISKIDPKIGESLRKMKSSFSHGTSVGINSIDIIDQTEFNYFPSIDNIAKNLGKLEIGQSNREVIEQFAKVIKNLDKPSELRQIAKEYFKDDYPHGWYNGLRYPGRLKLHVRRRNKYVH